MKHSTSMMKFQSIMVIDHDPVRNFMTQRILKKAGICNQSIFYKNGIEAFDLLETNGIRPELIFVGTYMSVMDGYEFIEKAIDKGINRRSKF